MTDISHSHTPSPEAVKARAVLLGRSRWGLAEIAFWAIAAACYFLLPTKLSLLSEIAILGLLALLLRFVAARRDDVEILLLETDRIGDGAEGERSAAWVDRQMGKVHSSLAAMSAGLADKPWCCNGNHLTLADVAVGCALAYLDFRFAHIDWRASHGNLQRLSEKLFARPSFIDSQPPAA